MVIFSLETNKNKQRTLFFDLSRVSSIRLMRYSEVDLY